jgi:FKBP-type peptidyl-prolyl cis-trans isomerase
MAKLDELTKLISVWKSALQEERDAPAVAETVPEPPAESIDFSVNVTHTPAKCKRKSTEGAVMKVHYVGKLLANGKVFASSFHTGSTPFRFVLGSDEVLDAWNQGLGDMCEGERRRLMVPWDMGYGEKGGKGVPPYSDLQYDFELVEMSLPKIPKIKKGKAEL